MSVLEAPAPLSTRVPELVPLVSEPPLADAAPLTSEPPLAGEAPLTAEPSGLPFGDDEDQPA